MLSRVLKYCISEGFIVLKVCLHDISNNNDDNRLSVDNFSSLGSFYLNFLSSKRFGFHLNR